MDTKNEQKIVYKCSNSECGFKAFLPIDAVILCPDGPNNMKNVKMGDTCSFCNKGKIVGDSADKKLDPKEYPTLVQYQPSQIWDAVKRLQEKYPEMSEDQCLLNLEMDLAEQDQIARGS